MINIKLIDDGKQTTIPSWMQFYLNLGQFISENLEQNKIITAAVSIPTRSYASVATASSIIINRLNIPPLYFISEQINIFRKLPIGTSIVHRRDGRNKRARFNGICIRGGNEYICLKTEQRTEVYVPIIEALRLCIVEDREFSLPGTQKGTKCVDASPLIQKIIPKENQDDFIDKTRLNCMIIGRIARLQEDAERKCLLVDSTYIGSFNEILRSQNLQNQNAAFRSVIVSQSTKKFHFSDNQKPEIIILDNALSYLRWRKEIKDFNKIVFFDKTDRNYDEGVAEINHYYATNNLNNIKTVAFPLHPAVDLMIFTEQENR